MSALRRLSYIHRHLEHRGISLCVTQNWADVQCGSCSYQNRHIISPPTMTKSKLHLDTKPMSLHSLRFFHISSANYRCSDSAPKPSDDHQSCSGEFYIKLRGLPFSSSKQDILKFLNGVNIVGGESGITLTLTRDRRPSGEAFVSVATHDDQQLGLKYDHKYIGERYITVFETNQEEFDAAINPTQASDGVLRLRGLPYNCTKEDIFQFFSGYEIADDGITFAKSKTGKFYGKAYVQFISQSVAESAANDRHKAEIGNRYIELFRSSLMEAERGGGGGGGDPVKSG